MVSQGCGQRCQECGWRRSALQGGLEPEHKHPLHFEHRYSLAVAQLQVALALACGCCLPLEMQEGLIGGLPEFCHCASGWWPMNGSGIKNDDWVVNSVSLRFQLWHYILRLFSLRLGVGFLNFYWKFIFFCTHTVKYSEFELGLLETGVHVGIAGDAVLGLLVSVSPWKCQWSKYLVVE